MNFGPRESIELTAPGRKPSDCIRGPLWADKPTQWFTADNHFGHARILEYTDRPFASVDEMDAAMVDRWNAIVMPGDLVYHLGDFALCRPGRAIEIARSLRGQKYLVFGNHDKNLRRDPEFLKHWIWARDLTKIETRVEDSTVKVVLCHYALLTWEGAHRGNWMLHGHSHGSLKPPGAAARHRRLDVGVDVWDYAPVSLATLADHMKDRGHVAVDHHEER